MSDLLQELGGIFFLGSISFVALWIAKRKGFFETLGRELLTLPLSLAHVLIVFAIYFGVSSFLLPPLLGLLRKLFQFANASDGTLAFLVLLQLILSLSIAALLLLFCKTLNPQIIKSIWRSQEHRGSYKKDIATAAAAWVISLPLLLFVSQLLDVLVRIFFHVQELPDQTAVRFLKMTLTHPALFSFTLFSIVILAPFIEELMFRGFLQTYIRKFFRPPLAISLSSFCFAFFHFSPDQGLGNIPIIGSLFILALFLGFIYERNRSLSAPLALHALFNAISVLNLYFLGGTPRWIF